MAAKPNNDYQLIVIGGGSAGLAAACSAKESGLDSVLILEREPALGGVLRQCIHTGFGLKYFRKELSGPEYARYFVQRAKALGVEFKTSAAVLSIDKNKTITAVSSADGLLKYQPQAIIAAMGCRERALGSLSIAGTRPTGVYTAGAVQKMINIHGMIPGKRAAVLGSGDLGMIVARRLVLEHISVAAMIEIQPQVSGLLRNKVQCIDDFNIPLMLSHTVTEVHGNHRVKAVTVCPVDENRHPIYEKKEQLLCDTLITSVGLIPEAELLRGLDVNSDGLPDMEWLFTCGNLLFVHDLVDDVTDGATVTGKNAASYILHGNRIENKAGETTFDRPNKDKMYNRINEVDRKAFSIYPNELICILCPNSCIISVNYQDGKLMVENQLCERGEQYARSEVEGQFRTVSSTVPLNSDLSKRLPVRSSKPIPKSKTEEVLKKIRALQLQAPVAYHQVLIHNVLGMDADIIASVSSAEIEH